MLSPPIRILIADDHEVIRRGLRDVIRTQPHLEIVAEASNGIAALKAARSKRPQIAIVDYSLPGLNGHELTIQLKREVPGVEIVIFTMHDRENVIIDALQAGARGYVHKSDHYSSLLKAIDELAAHRPYFSPCVAELLLGQFLQAEVRLNDSLLSVRERGIVQLVAEGKLNRQIAELLSLSIKTVETHRHSAMEKLKLRTTADLVRYAVREGLVEA